MLQLVAYALLGPYQDACGFFSCGRHSCAEGYKPAAGSQLTETRYAIIACLKSTYLLLAVAPWSGSSQSLGKWASSHVVWYMGYAISGKRDTVVFFWRERGQSYCFGFQRARRREEAVASHLALAARRRHESISFVDESLDTANAFGSLDRKTLKT